MADAPTEEVVAETEEEIDDEFEKEFDEEIENEVEKEAEAKTEAKIEEEEEELEPWRKDPRMMYIRAMVEKLANIKTDQWIKMIDKVENQDLIFEFLNNVERTKLFFVKFGATIMPSLDGFPVDFTKGKFIYFLRRSNHQQITETNYRQAVLVGSCSDNPMRDFSIFVNNAVVPLLMNPKNQANWPNVLKTEMGKKLQDLRNSITETMGVINDRTVLPLPVTLTALMKIAPNIMNGDCSKFTMTMQESIEQIVLRWSRSVNAYISRSSLDIFNAQKYATIDDEADFWRARLDNLKNIYNQLRSKEIKAIALILEKVESVYVNQMKRILSSVASAYEQAYDIDLYLKPLQNQLDKFRSTEFAEAQYMIAPLMHTLVLIWSKSKHLSSNERIVHLFKLLHHKIFEFVNDGLNPTSIFAGDIADTLEKIEKTLTNLAYYKETFAKYRTNLDQYHSSGAGNAELWSFDPDEIFANFDRFVQRIIKTNEMLQLLFELKKMEDTVFGGHTGKRVTQAVQKISDSVSILTDSLKDIQFNVLDLDESENFARLIEKFEDEVTDLQQKLAKQYAMSFDECNTISKCIKLIVNLGNTLHLPIVYQEISPKFERIARMLVAEVTDIEEVFKKQLPHFETKSFDEVLIWMGKLKSRLTEQTKYMESQKVKLFDSDYGHYAIIRYTKMLDTLENWEKQYVKKQIDRCVESTDVIMSNYLLIRDEDQKLAINVRPEFDALLQGMNRMIMNSISLEKDQLKQLSDRRNELWTVKMKLYRIIEWYNFTQFEVLQFEKHLIEPNSRAIDEMVKSFLEKYTWKTYDSEALDVLFNTLEHLYKRVIKAHENIQNIGTKMRSWADVPLYERESDNIHERFEESDDLNDDKANNNELDKDNSENVDDDNAKSTEIKNGILHIQNRDDIIGKRYKQCSDTQELIQSVMIENYCLFRNKCVSINEEKDVSINVNQNEPQQQQEDDIDEMVYVPYEKYVDEIVGDNILLAVETSLKYVYNEIRSPWPLVEVCFSLDVERRQAIFLPDLDVDAKEGFVAFMTSLMVDIFGMAGLIKRVSTNFERLKPIQASSGDDLPTEQLVESIDGVDFSDANFGDADNLENADNSEEYSEKPKKSKKLVAIVDSSTPVDSNTPIDSNTPAASAAQESPKTPEIALVDKQTVSDYTILLKDNATIEEYRLDILVQSKQISKETLDTFQTFEKFAFVWMIDRSEYLAAFLKYGRQLTHEDILKIQENEFDDEPKMPTLEAIEHEIKRHRDLIPEIESIPEFIDTAPWFRVKMHLFKTKLIDETLKWMNLFMDYLHNHVTNRLNDLETFILDANIVLSSRCDKAEIDKFRKMHNLNAILF